MLLSIRDTGGPVSFTKIQVNHRVGCTTYNHVLCIYFTDTLYRVMSAAQTVKTCDVVLNIFRDWMNGVTTIQACLTVS